MGDKDEVRAVDVDAGHSEGVLMKSCGARHRVSASCRCSVPVWMRAVMREAVMSGVRPCGR